VNGTVASYLERPALAARPPWSSSWFSSVVPRNIWYNSSMPLPIHHSQFTLKFEHCITHATEKAPLNKPRINATLQYAVNRSVCMQQCSLNRGTSTYKPLPWHLKLTASWHFLTKLSSLVPFPPPASFLSLTIILIHYVVRTLTAINDV
jgi:hypothetical protein